MAKKFIAVLEQRYEIKSENGPISMRTVVIKNHKGKTVQTLQSLNNPLAFEEKLRENGWKTIQQLDENNFQIEQDFTANPEKEKIETNKKAVTGCCSILGLIFIVIFTIGLFSSSSSKDDPVSDGKNEITAGIYCEEAVKRQLIDAPSTAEFTNVRPVNSVEIQGEDQWIFLGHVEYENAIGGKSGGEFRCNVQYSQADEQWSGRAEFT